MSACLHAVLIQGWAVSADYRYLIGVMNDLWKNHIPQVCSCVQHLAPLKVFCVANSKTFWADTCQVNMYTCQKKHAHCMTADSNLLQGISTNLAYPPYLRWQLAMTHWLGHMDAMLTK
jgi:hypothetical protein